MIEINLIVFFFVGLKSEGLYRVSGFTEHIEDVKMAFDRGMVLLTLDSFSTKLLAKSDTIFGDF